jgi:hypothetical protein
MRERHRSSLQPQNRAVLRYLAVQLTIAIEEAPPALNVMIRKMTMFYNFKSVGSIFSMFHFV